MNLTTIKDFLGKSGEWVSVNITQKVIHWLGSQGVNLGITASKILSIIVFLLIALGIIKILHSLRGIIKWSLVALFILLAISVGISFL
jgi:hypothetical protein